MEPPDDYWDAEDFDDNDELEELVLESYLGNLIFEPPAVSQGGASQPLEGSEVSFLAYMQGIRMQDLGDNLGGRARTRVGACARNCT